MCRGETVVLIGVRVEFIIEVRFKQSLVGGAGIGRVDVWERCPGRRKSQAGGMPGVLRVARRGARERTVGKAQGALSRWCCPKGALFGYLK